MYILKFGKYKGKDLTQVPTEYLEWLVFNTDVDDPKYKLSNMQLVAACNEVIKGRSGGRMTSPAPSEDVRTIQIEKPGKQSLIKSVKGLIESLYKHASEMQKYLDEYDEDGNVTTRKSDHFPC